MRSLVALLLLASPAVAAEPVPLFNGKDLAGWVNVNCAPATFAAKNNEIVTTGSPTGYLRTGRQYENFVLEMDWLHENKKDVGNSGLFVWGDALPAVGTGYTRGIEVQVLVNLTYRDKAGRVTASSHGDLFSIWGAKCTPDRPHPSGWERCLPSEDRAKGGGEWNHYTVTANDGTIKLAVNGKEVSGVSKCSPRKGYLALESEGAVCHFRNLTIQELPTTNPPKEQTATLDAEHASLFDGLTLAGWTGDGWTAGDGRLKSKGTGDLTTAKLPAGELLFDWKLPAKSVGEFELNVGGKAVIVKQPPLVKAGTWTRHTQTIPAGPVTVKGVEGLEVMNVFFAAKE